MEESNPHCHSVKRGVSIPDAVLPREIRVADRIGDAYSAFIEAYLNGSDPCGPYPCGNRGQAQGHAPTDTRRVLT